MKKLIFIILLGGGILLAGDFYGSIPVVYKSNTTGEIEGMMTEESYPDVITGLKESELPKKYELIWTK